MKTKEAIKTQIKTKIENKGIVGGLLHFKENYKEERNQMVKEKKIPSVEEISEEFSTIRQRKLNEKKELKLFDTLETLSEMALSQFSRMFANPTEDIKALADCTGVVVLLDILVNPITKQKLEIEPNEIIDAYIKGNTSRVKDLEEQGKSYMYIETTLGREAILLYMHTLLKEGKAEFLTKEKTKNRKSLDIIPRLANPILKEYQNALNHNGLMGILDEKAIEEIEFNNGKAYVKGNPYKTYTLADLKQKETRIKNFDYGLLKGLYSIIFQIKDKLVGTTAHIPLKTLEDYTGKNTRGTGQTVSEFIKKVSMFNNAYGFLPNGSHYKLITYLGLDAKTNELKFDVSFLIELIKDQQTERIKGKEKKLITQDNHSYLIHSDIIKERDKIAFYMVEKIEQLLISAGEKTHEVSIKVSTLIDKIPELKDKLEEAEKTKSPRTRKNTYLKRHFEKMYQLIREKTDFYKYFNELNIPEVIPTVTTLDQVIYIIHKGKNKDYKPR